VRSVLPPPPFVYSASPCYVNHLCERVWFFFFYTPMERQGIFFRSQPASGLDCCRLTSVFLFLLRSFFAGPSWFSPIFVKCKRPVRQRRELRFSSCLVVFFLKRRPPLPHIRRRFLIVGRPLSVTLAICFSEAGSTCAGLFLAAEACSGTFSGKYSAF